MRFGEFTKAAYLLGESIIAKTRRGSLASLCFHEDVITIERDLSAVELQVSAINLYGQTLG
jgi:hypothetical protein